MGGVRVITKTLEHYAPKKENSWATSKKKSGVYVCCVGTRENYLEAEGEIKKIWGEIKSLGYDTSSIIPRDTAPISPGSTKKIFYFFFSSQQKLNQDKWLKWLIALNPIDRKFYATIGPEKYGNDELDTIHRERLRTSIGGEKYARDFPSLVERARKLREDGKNKNSVDLSSIDRLVLN